MSVNSYTFCFAVQFPEDIVEAEFALFAPYTYTHQLRVIAKLAEFELQRGVKLQNVQACKSYFGNIIPAIKLSQVAGIGAEPAKEIILVFARVAAQDSYSSWVTEGLIGELIGQYDA